MKKLWMSFLLASLVGTALAEGVLPPLIAKDLLGRPADLPTSLSGKAAIFIVGFTQASSDSCKVWEDRLWELQATNPGCKMFSIIPLEGVPGFMVPFIASRIRAKTPQLRFENVFLLRQGRQAWEQWVNYDPEAGKDDSYLVMVNADQKITWQGQGPFNPAKLVIVKSELKELTP